MTDVYRAGYVGQQALVQPPHSFGGTGADQRVARSDHTHTNSGIEFKEADGSPDVTTVTKVVVTNGKMTDNGSGQITLDLTGTATSFAAPSLVLSTTNSSGVAGTALRTDATIAAFDATVPVTQAFSDAAATGAASVAARRDHKHGMPATPATPATIDPAQFWMQVAV